MTKAEIQQIRDMANKSGLLEYQIVNMLCDELEQAQAEIEQHKKALIYQGQRAERYRHALEESKKRLMWGNSDAACLTVVNLINKTLEVADNV